MSKSVLASELRPVRCSRNSAGAVFDCLYVADMSYEAVRIARFGGPEVLELATLPDLPAPASGQLRIKVLAAGTGFTDVFIRRGRYPDVKGPLPLIPGYEVVGVVDAIGPGVAHPALGTCVADMGVTGGYAQYASAPADRVVPVPDGIDPGQAACIPLAYVTAYQMLVRVRQLPEGATVLVIGGSGTVGTALLDLARHLGFRAIGTCSGQNAGIVEGFGATAIDYAAQDFAAEVSRLTGGRGVDAAFDAIGGAHFTRSFDCLAKGGLLIGYGSQTMANGSESIVSAGLGLARLKLWGAAPMLFGDRSATFYSITARRKSHAEQFKADMATLFALLRDGQI